MTSNAARWFRFNAVGAMGALVQLSSLALLVRVYGIGTMAATALSVEAAIVHNFVWHRNWTWARKPAGAPGWASSFFRFHLANGAISIAGNFAFMAALTGTGGMPPIAAGLLSIALCSLLNFLVASRWVFAATGGQPDGVENGQPRLAPSEPVP